MLILDPIQTVKRNNKTEQLRQIIKMSFIPWW